MSGGVLEVLVGAEQLEVVGDAQLSDEGVDGAELNSGAATRVSQVCSRDVVLSRRLNEGKCAQASTDLGLGALRQKTLKKLLDDEACRDHQVRLDSHCQTPDRGAARWGVTTKCKRPDAGVDQNRHVRERCAL